jgi:acyl-homoserine-lactone acylase
LLEAWDNRAARESRGAVVFYQFWDTYSVKVDQPFAQPWDERRPMDTPAGLAEPATAVRHLEDAVGWVRAKYGREDVAWGDVFRFRMGTLDLPADGGPGSLGLYRVMGFREQPDGRWIAGRSDDATDLAGSGDAWVLLVHFTKPVQAFSVLAYGQTTDPASRHSADQIRLFANQQLRPVRFSAADVGAHTEREYRPESPAVDASRSTPAVRRSVAFSVPAFSGRPSGAGCLGGRSPARSRSR